MAGIAPFSREQISSIYRMNLFLDKFPPTVDLAVDKLLEHLSFAERTRLANMDETALIQFHRSYGRFLQTEFRIAGNDPLLASCRRAARLETITAEQASLIILKALQKRILAGNVLKLVR
ncbi:MAG: hypothetical protein CSA23_05770 [Deltaproteobacteria bacterium]|nr:MAG: hypothetical protein CSA23_05770 [Deltaproteobacteria bacterium]